jgi:DNA-binding Lrp family transcriptional regulator
VDYGWEILERRMTLVEAYVLLQTEQGRMAEIAQSLAQLHAVDEANVVTGPYDVIARVQADDIDAIGKLIVSEVQTVGGVTRTLTCPVVHL